MAAINTALIAREATEAMNVFAKRKSWPAKNAGVMVVFCIVFVGTASRTALSHCVASTNSLSFLVAAGLIGLWISKVLARRKAAKEPKY